MKSFLMSSAAVAVLSLGLAAPAAADCAADIASLKAETFTGSVNAAPDADAVAPAAEITAPDTAAAPAADSTAPVDAAGGAAPAVDTNASQVAAADSGAPADAAAVPSAPAEEAVPGTEATAAMNAVTEGIATSPEEVDEQQTAQPAETAPSAEQLASADEPLAPAASPTSGGEPVDLQATMLARAEAYQKLGNEGACMNVIEQAKTMTQ